MAQVSTAREAETNKVSVPARELSRKYTLWVHNEAFAKEDILFNASCFAPDVIQNGQTLKVSRQDGNVKVRDFQPPAPGDKSRRGDALESATAEYPGDAERPYDPKHGDELREVSEGDSGREFVFLAKDMNVQQKAKHPTLQISVSQKIARLYGFRNRTSVLVSTVNEGTNSASHIEIAFRDSYLSRGDMWRLAAAELNGQTLYEGKPVLYLDSVKATVKTVWSRGAKARSAIFTSQTKPIFRSESARFVLYIQMSKEMWEFETDGTGYLYFERVVETLLPELFKRWNGINAHHLVSIVLFTRMKYDNTPQRSPYDDHLEVDAAETSAIKDFYRVVVSDMESGEWTRILDQLKREFKTFLKDITLDKRVSVKRDQTNDEVVRTERHYWGKPTAAVEGNILEAISLASIRFAKDHVDRDLVRTGLSIIVITPGTGHFEVSKDMLFTTTQNLSGNGIGIDLICLQRPPLHTTPIFKYPVRDAPRVGQRNHQATALKSQQVVSDTRTTLNSSVTGSKWGDDEHAFAIPHWVDVSFWLDSSSIYYTKEKRSAERVRQKAIDTLHERPFVPTVRMYDAQMMGFMENEQNNIQIPYLHETNPLAAGEEDYCDPTYWDRYDELVFAPADLGLQSLHKTTSKEREPLMTPQNPTPKTKFQDLASPKPGHSPPSHDSSPGNTFFDKQMKTRDRTKERDAKQSVQLEPSAGPSASTYSAPEIVRPSRQTALSYFAGRAQKTASNKATAKSEAVTRVESTHAVRTPSQSQKTPAPPTTPSRQNTQVSEQISATLSQGAAAFSTEQAQNEGDDSRSKPISIQANMHTSTKRKGESKFHDSNTARSSLESKPLDVIQAASVSKSAGPGREILGRTPPQRSKTYVSDEKEEEELPWLTILNPCISEEETNVNIRKQFGRWQHVFPGRRTKRSSMKWTSITMPAALPLTCESLPEEQIIRSRYEDFPYKVHRNEDFDISETQNNHGDLVRDLIGYRLSHGFQILTTPTEFLKSKSLRHEASAIKPIAHKKDVPVANEAYQMDPLEIFDENFSLEDGGILKMVKGSIIHELHGLPNGDVQVIRRHRKKTSREAQFLLDGTPYEAHIQTMLSPIYETHNLNLLLPLEEYNWSIIDSFLAGYRDGIPELMKKWRARFVLIPVGTPPASRRPFPLLSNDSDEEIRIQGLQRLTQMWQRNRIDNPGEYRTQTATDRRNDPNPLAIEYQTRDPSIALATGLGGSKIVFEDPNEPTMQLSVEPKQFTTSEVDLRSIAIQLQSAKGIKIGDRRWHLRLHRDCFDGVDLTSWLLQNYKDIDTREAAVAHGNELMKRGLFEHVQRNHQFRDGNFFYSLSEEYRQPRPESRTGWFGTRKATGSVPSTPLMDPVRTPMSIRSPAIGQLPQSESPDINISQDKQVKVALSGVLQYSVDKRRSKSKEIINLHYSRLHNPENCYHIRIDWMNVTARLIEDSIVQWSNLVARYGLKLVEVPISEAAAINDTHPFRSPFIVSLAVLPPDTSGLGMDHVNALTKPETPEVAGFAESKRSPAQAAASTSHIYHRALLKKFDFVMDMEAASNYPETMDVSYSWGKPDYKFTQYIHRTGILLVEITDNGDFLLAANRMCHNRDASSVAHDSSRVERDALERDAASHSQAPSGKHGHAKAEKTTLTAEKLKDNLEEFCSNKAELRKLYAEVRKGLAEAAEATATVPPTPTVDELIPSLELPSKA